MGNSKAKLARQQKQQEQAAAAAERRSSVDCAVQDPELPEDVKQAFKESYSMRATALQGQKFGALDVRGVFIKAIELLGWTPERAVPINEVCDGMCRRLGKRGKLDDEAAFFSLFVQIALAPEHATEFGAVLEDDARNTVRQPRKSRATESLAAGSDGPSVRDSPFQFTSAATHKAVQSHHACFLWTETWKRVHDEGGKRYHLPGYVYAFENASDCTLKFALDFGASENYEIVAPSLRHVTRDHETVTRVVNPGEVVFMAQITQASTTGGLSAGLRMKVTDIVDRHIYT